MLSVCIDKILSSISKSLLKTMNTTPSERLNGLDHLRALAIVLVYVSLPVFDHPDWIDTIGRFGWIGVDLFFVLSGFLISGQLFDSIKNTTTFLSGLFLSNDFSGLFRRIFSHCFFISASLSSGKEKHYHLYGSLLLSLRIMDWTLLTVVLFHMRGLCVSKNSFIYSCLSLFYC